MQPTELKPESFAKYPPQGRALAVRELAVLRELPLSLAPILLREVLSYDWKMPAERQELTRQFSYLNSLDASERATALGSFRALKLSPELERTDWVNDPSGFMEMLTAWLWSSHQMDQFKSVADLYSGAIHRHAPDAPPTQPRLGIVIIGGGADTPDMPVFRKLRPYGVRLTAVKPEDGVAILLAEAERRGAAAHTREDRFRHWYIDGGEGVATPHLTQVTYQQLDKPRSLLLSQIQRSIATGVMGPEQLRSLLARIQPVELGLGASLGDEVLNHFKVSLLTEGAGTQIFSTTFVQWAARECIRRAHPETVIVRYAPRQKAQTMNMMLTGAVATGTDVAGSVVDADLGAYYTWINLRRLSGAEQMRFLVWFEGHREAVAIGPGLPQGTTANSVLDMHQVLNLLG